MKPCWIFLLSFLFLAGFLPVTAAETEIVITVPSAVEVAGDEMILGELAEITAPPEQREKIARINLGRAPRFGDTAWLYRTNVLYALERTGLASDCTLEMPTKVRVGRAGQLLTAGQILAAVEAYLRAEASPHWTAWRVEPSRLQERPLPCGELELKIEGEQSPLKPGRNTFRIRVVVDGAVFITLPVTIQLTIEAPVYVTTQKLERYTELSADRLSREVRALVTGKEWLTPLPVEAYWVIRDLPAGKVLTSEDLQEKPVIFKGSKVRLVLESGPVQVELTAQAEEHGWLGDRITVTNLGSNQKLTATVTGPGMVEVTLE
ncbi:MAG TPA: flagellar basal body P-ring formation protein FlgA [Firmicutes bacterium]|jgi:flagella basal body P-ring formation protein FlgA|nr:flagellar basal body P-ring formation protein FlgA [Bacillota bacterium]